MKTKPNKLLFKLVNKRLTNKKVKNIFANNVATLKKTKIMEAINIIAYPKNNSQIEAIKAVMKAFKIKFEISKEDSGIDESLLTVDQQKQMTQQEFVQWIEDAEKSPSMTLDAFNEKWEQEIQGENLVHEMKPCSIENRNGALHVFPRLKEPRFIFFTTPPHTTTRGGRGEYMRL